MSPQIRHPESAPIAHDSRGGPCSWDQGQASPQRNGVHAHCGPGQFICAVLDAVGEQIAVLDEAGALVAVNEAWRRFGAANGAAGDRAIGVGADYLAACSISAAAGDRDAMRAAVGIRAVLARTQSAFSMEYACHTPDAQRWFYMSVARLGYGRPGALVIHHDITERKAQDERIRVASIAFESSEGMMITDANARILQVNQAFTKITGFTQEEVLGKTPAVLSSGKHDAAFYGDMWKCIHATGSWEGEIWNRRKNGEIYPQRLRVTSVRDTESMVTHHVGSFSDITLSKAASEEIRSLAFYDPLTRLPNRRLLLDRLNHMLASLPRQRSHGALLFLDLDHFKTLNDTLGHAVGDQLLQQVAQRLTACVRASDTVARIGGDEFVIILENLSETKLDAATEAETVCNNILRVLHAPYNLAEQTCHITSSIGLTLFGDGRLSADELLIQADIAMYQTKKSGRNSYHFFDQDMQDSVTERALMESQLRQALKNSEFELYYQPQVNADGITTGAEGLIRWNRPGTGFVSPAEFIPLAEETGLILPIGDWVLEQAAQQLQAWRNDAATRQLVLAINISALQFRQPDFEDKLRSLILLHSLDPTRLKLELTESIMLDYFESTILTLRSLRELGVQFSLDDFGTGYSSLQYLKRLPVDQLKIDQSFVRDLADDSSDQAIVRTIIAMAKSMNLEVIAEGVETEQQRILLMSMGCRHFQGYLFGRPAPVGSFLNRVRDEHSSQVRDAASM